MEETNIQSLIYQVFKPQKTSEEKFLGEISHRLEFDIEFAISLAKHLATVKLLGPLV